MDAYLSQNQFQIVVGMSEAEIEDVSFVGDHMIIAASNINILYDFSRLKLPMPDISYDDWLAFKYLNKVKPENWNNYEHIYIEDTVQFAITQPSIFYEGEQEQFFELLSKFDFVDIENPEHRYIFGGTYKDSSHDEFEVHSNSPIEIHIFDESIEKAIKNFNDEENKINKFKSAVETKLKKEKLRKRKNTKDKFILSSNLIRY